jgi:leucyl aminopeptidase (aminopeptidase T)
VTPPRSDRRITARSGSFALPAYPNVDYSLLTAAGRIVEGALSVVSGEAVVIIVGADQRAFGETVATVAHTMGAKPQLLILEDHGARPHDALAPAIIEALAQAQASVFCADSRPDEKAMRVALLGQSTRLGIRHAHLVGVTRRSLLAGFSAEPRRLAEAARAVRVRVRPSSVFRVKSPAGTDLTVRCDPACRWSDHSGPIRAGRWENLPAGEVLTCPADASGLYVATASMSSSFGVQREALRHCPLRLWFEHGVLKRMESPE